MDKTYLFEKAPVPRAVAELAVPTVISQVIAMIYNMADTFYVGQLGDPDQVAAVSLAAPMALLLTALSNLFGIGGSALMSRALGAKKPERAALVSSFSFYASLCLAVLAALLVLIFRGTVLKLIGADESTAGYTGRYLTWVFILGGVPSLLSMSLAHLVRADGAPRQASIGLSLGGVLNIFLDPIFIFERGFGLGVTGAAVATFISNLVTLAYFFAYLYRKRDTTAICISPKKLSFDGEICTSVITTGLPGTLQTLLASVSNAVLNNLAAPYGSTAIAAFGVAKKLDTIPMNISIGLAQGVMPFLGYNFSARKYDRLKGATRFTLFIAVAFSVFCVVLFEIFTEPLIRIFINDPATVAYGRTILRIMCIATPLMAVGFLMITMFQASGKPKQGLILSVCRKGAVDIPLMLLMSAIWPLYGLACVQPMTEGIAMAIALIFYAKFKKQLIPQTAGANGGTDV